MDNLSFPLSVSRPPKYLRRGRRIGSNPGSSFGCVPGEQDGLVLEALIRLFLIHLSLWAARRCGRSSCNLGQSWWCYPCEREFSQTEGNQSSASATQLQILIPSHWAWQMYFFSFNNEVKFCPVLTDAACPRGFARIKGVTCEGGCNAGMEQILRESAPILCSQGASRSSQDPWGFS